MGAKSDEGVGFIGTGLHRVALANLEDQFLSLEADGSCALTEVIRVIGPFPNVKNLLTGTSTIGPSTLRLTYTKVIDGTGAELTSSQARWKVYACRQTRRRGRGGRLRRVQDAEDAVG